MINVSQLPSSRINREIDELKNRSVPLTYRRFSDPFKVPDNTALLQALLLASTGRTNEIPNVIDSTTNSAFSQSINSMKDVPPILVDNAHGEANINTESTNNNNNNNNNKNKKTPNNENIQVEVDKQGNIKTSNLRGGDKTSFGNRQGKDFNIKEALNLGHIKQNGNVSKHIDAEKVNNTITHLRGGLKHEIEKIESIQNQLEAATLNTNDRNVLKQRLRGNINKHNIIKKEIENNKNVLKSLQQTINDSIRQGKVERQKNKKPSVFVGGDKKELATKRNVSGDISKIIQNEVYENVEDRGIIKGYKKLPNYNDERTAVYKHKLDKIIHVGIRGTALSSFDDLMNDMDLVIKNIPFPNVRTKEDDYINTRLDKDFDTYKRLRKQYPDHKIILNGHSLGAVVVKHILDNTDDKNIEGHLFNPWLFNDYTKDINKDKRAVINDSDDLLSTPLRTLLKSIGILGTVGGVGAKIKNMFLESKKEQMLNSPEYSLFQAQSIYNRILNAFPGLPPLLMREQEAIFTNNFGNSRDQLERYLMSNSPETPLFRYYGTESFIENLENYDRQISNFNRGLINIKKYGKNVISGMLATSALHLANIIYKYHASTNFKPKNKKLLIKK